MDQQIRIIIYKKKYVYDNVVITPNMIQNNIDDGKRIATFFILPLNKKGCNAYLASAYIANMNRSTLYRKHAYKKLLKFCEKHCQNINNLVIFVRLLTPRQQFLDYNWGHRIVKMAYEHQEIDYAMSWLSTLGGAFSALGEEFEHCAEMAGKISIKQFQLALQLGDPLLVARCKLFTALSLIQRNYLRLPKCIIQEVYKLAIKENDIRLQKMCHGIWAKLKYYFYLRKKSKIVKNGNQIIQLKL